MDTKNILNHIIATKLSSNGKLLSITDRIQRKIVMWTKTVMIMAGDKCIPTFDENNVKRECTDHVGCYRTRICLILKELGFYDEELTKACAFGCQFFHPRDELMGIKKDFDETLNGNRSLFDEARPVLAALDKIDAKLGCTTVGGWSWDGKNSRFGRVSFPFIVIGSLFETEPRDKWHSWDVLPENAPSKKIASKETTSEKTGGVVRTYGAAAASSGARSYKEAVGKKSGKASSNDAIVAAHTNMPSLDETPTATKTRLPVPKSQQTDNATSRHAPKRNQKTSDSDDDDSSEGLMMKAILTLAKKIETLEKEKTKPTSSKAIRYAKLKSLVDE